ncbi:coiled-coil domain-containing protein 170 [Brienomyrus brachyistius]|uniref:coiled-coil domain-containing protein 170 n=1 Tax=Brienomyrus brachyistius TaxID=42636 RepID=UPI0020B389E6|nr:coiled-coil domain-containing protein 170 [Brienomyrus brachyistius]
MDINRSSADSAELPASGLNEMPFNTIQDQVDVLKKRLQVKEDMILSLTSDTKYSEGRKEAEQQPRDAGRRYHDVAFRLADRLSINLRGNEDPLDFIVHLVDTLCEEKGRRRSEMRSLKNSMAASEVECRAGRQTVMRLVAEVRREQSLAAARAEEVETLRKDIDQALLAKRKTEAESEVLREKLESGQRALADSQQEADRLGRHSQELSRQLHRSQIEAQAVKALLRAFGQEVTEHIRDQSSPASEEDVQKKLRELCRSRDTGVENIPKIEDGLSEVLGELARLFGLHQGVLERARSAEQQVQELGRRQKELEAELVTAEVLGDGLSRERHNNLRFLEQLSERLKLERLAAEMGFDMQAEAILLRVERLVKQEERDLVESKTLARDLQRKMKVHREQLQSKELHMDMLRRKVAQLEEEKRSRSALAVERDDAHLTARKLQKKVERLQKELEALHHSDTELKARLCHTNELKIKVLEQNQTIEVQGKSLDRLQKEKAKATGRLAMEKTELESRYQEAVEGQQQVQRSLQSRSSELRILQQTVLELTEKERQLTDFRKVVASMLGLDINTLAVPDYEIIKTLEGFLHASPHTHRLCQCLDHTHRQLTLN